MNRNESSIRLSNIYIYIYICAISLSIFIAMPSIAMATDNVDVNEPTTTAVNNAEAAPNADVPVETRDVSLNTQFVSLDRKWSRIPGAVSKMVNKDTNQEFLFTMSEGGEIPHLQLPVGTYELSFVSVPADSQLLKGKSYEIPAPETETIEPGQNYGLTLTLEEKAPEQPAETKGEYKVVVNVNKNKTTLSDEEVAKLLKQAKPSLVSGDKSYEFRVPDATAADEKSFISNNHVPAMVVKELPIGEYTLNLSAVDGYKFTLKVDTSMEKEYIKDGKVVISNDLIPGVWRNIYLQLEEVPKAVEDTKPSTPGISSGSDGNKAEYTGFYNSLDESDKNISDKNDSTNIKSKSQYKTALPKTSDVMSIIPVVAGFSALLIGMGYISYRKFSN